ncbi:MAG: ATPase domain-containing protein [Actinomycetota bacterium]
MTPTYPLNTIKHKEITYLSTGVEGLDKLLGGGFVKGSSTLLAGTRGAGKSTVALQAASSIAEAGSTVLYVSGEESKEQVKTRAERMCIASDKIILSENPELGSIYEAQATSKADIIFIDSMQLLYCTTVNRVQYTPTQVRYCLLELCNFARRTNTAVVFIGHAIKGGYIAGLMTYQHMVDVVLFLELDEDGETRILKCDKNRYAEPCEPQHLFMGRRGLFADLIQNEQKHIRELKLTQRQLNEILKGRPIWTPIVKRVLSGAYMPQQVKEAAQQFLYQQAVNKNFTEAN